MTIWPNPSVDDEFSLSTPLMPDSLSSSRVDDLALHHVRRRARVRDADEHDRLVDVRELVSVEPGKRREPEHDQGDHRDDRDDRPLDGEVGNEHGWR